MAITTVGLLSPGDMGHSIGKVLHDNGILAYWRKHGFPPQCRARGDVVSCE